MIIRFEDFFSKDEIIARLCRERLAARARLHENYYLDHLAPSRSSTIRSAGQEILGYLPPRSRWYRQHKAEREKGKGTFRELHVSLMKTVHQLRQDNSPVDQDWIRRQDRLISAVRFRALSSPRVVINSPAIVPSPKNGNSREYRILATYPLECKIVIGQCAAYLRAFFEEEFLSCSFAFRFPTKETEPVTHHDAFSRLAEFWNENKVRGGIDAWVAECDIQGFFDTVCHQVVLREFDEGVKRLARQDRYIDARSRNVILAYLRSYSYTGYATQEAKRILARIDRSATVKDRTQAINSFHRSIDPSRIGVPQGGALSCFFANLLLHRADEAVMEIVAKHSENIVYVRYCDDMVIVGNNRSAVNETVAIYCETLRCLKLPLHELKSVRYGPIFWHEKSKLPYRWTRSEGCCNVPWLAFVGYQLRYDGMIRIRPSSVTKELEKQVRVTDAFLNHVVPALRSGRVHRNWRRMLASLTGRLEAMSVGRRAEWDFNWHDPSDCWCGGFKCLSLNVLPRNQKIVRTQLRRLDRNRGRQLARAKRKLSRFSKKLGRSAQNKRSVTPYSGKPKSYAGQFEKFR